MTSMAAKAFRPMLRPVRNVHLPGTPGIYNSKPNWKPGPNWQPQSYRGPFLNGWAVQPVLAAIQPGNAYFLFFKFMVAYCVGFWLPFYAVDFQMKKQLSA